MSTTNSTDVTTTAAINDRNREASRRLVARTAAIRERLEVELRRTQNDLELDWRALLVSQRDVAELAGRNSAPLADVFWLHQAAPRADDLRSACLEIIDAHLVLLWDALAAHWRTIAPSLDDNASREQARKDITRMISPLRTFTLDRSFLDDVGERWQERLRRQAIRRHLRTGGATDDGFSAAIDAHELQMLKLAPWAQADQLLSAFELVHTDIRRITTEKVDRIVADVLAD